MSKYEVIKPRSQALRVNLSDWCSRPTYRLGKPMARELLYHAQRGRLSQRSALAMLEDVTGTGFKTIELWCGDRHTNTYRVSSNMEALLKVCNLAIEKKATKNRRDGNPPMTAYTVEIY